MKKIMLLLLFVAFTVNAQNNKPDLVNRQMLKFLQTQDVSFSPIRDLLISKTETIKKETKDSLLIVDCDKYIISLNAIKFPDVKRGGLKNANPETLKNFYVETDKFNDITIISSKKSKSWFRISTFIRIYGKDVYLLLSTKYSGSDWIFMESVTALVDNEKLFYKTEKPDRNVSKTVVSVTEESTKIIDESLYDIISKISNSKTELDVRFDGSKGNYDTKLTLKEIEDIKKTLLLYNELLDK